MDILNYQTKFNLRPGEPQAFNLIRSRAAQRLKDLSWPTKASETWRYSPLSQLKKVHVPYIKEYLNEESHNLSEELYSKINADWPSTHYHTIILFNGLIIQKPSKIDHQIQIESLKTALLNGTIDVSILESESFLEIMNTCFLDTGLCLNILNHADVAKPIVLVNTYSGQSNDTLFQSRNFIYAQSQSNSTLIEAHYFENDKQIWINDSNKIYLSDSAKMKYISWSELPKYVQRTNINSFYLQGKDELFLFNGVLSENWFRNETNIITSGKESIISIQGLGFSYQNGIIDQQTNIRFENSDNKSEQFYRNLLKNSSRAIFNGKIHISKQALKTDSSQLHQSLLLSQTAEVDSKPELEIFADEVKATHGATVGQLDENEVFYLQSRGIPKSKAEKILSLAFMNKMIETINNEQLEKLLLDKLATQWEKSQI